MFRWMHAGPLIAVLACATALPSDSTSIAFKPVDPAVIQQRLQRATRKQADRKTAMESLFHEVGCDQDRLAQQHVPSSKEPNLVCILKGNTDSEIVVGGHFDSSEAGTGVVDDWSGAALLPSLYQSLVSEPRRHRFVFVAFAGEEEGLKGSHEFVSKLPREEVRRIHAKINLECLGVGPAKVWASRADPRLLNAYARVACALHVEARGMNVDGVGDDDSHPFLSAGIPVLTIHSLTRETLPLLHSKRDNLAAIRTEDYYTAYRLAATYLAFLDAELD